LTFASRGRGEFDAGPAKPTQSTGAAFGDGMAATRATRPAITPNEILILLARARATPIAVDLVRKVKTARTHRPANVPTRTYTEIGISFTEYRLAIPAK
jgi:hypothetical protein